MIIHPSPIISSGIASILARHFKAEVLQSADLQSAREQGTGPMDLVICDAGCIDPPAQGLAFYGPVRKVLSDPFPAGLCRIADLSISGDRLVELAGMFLRDNANKETKEGAQLTARETEVLRLVASGYSNKQIAGELFISIHTVISHRKRITEKTGIKSMSGLTIYAILQQLIDPGKILPE